MTKTSVLAMKPQIHMYQPSVSACLLCSFRAARGSNSKSVLQQWNSRRAASVKQLRPREQRGSSRMNLTQPRIVGAGPVRSDRPNRRKQDGPFGGMNRTVAPEDLRRRSGRISPREGRSTSGRSSRKGKDDKKGFKALNMQRALTRVSYDQRGRIKEQIREVHGFEDFGLLDSVRESIATQALDGMNDIVATPVQKIAIPALLGEKKRRQRNPDKPSQKEMKEYLIAAETGSGKTLAYLLPTINAIKLAEEEDAEIAAYERTQAEQRMQENNFSPPLSNFSHPTTGRPRVIILVPTAELVTQVGSLVKSFTHTVKFRAAMISAAVTGKVIRSRLFSPGGIDILVSTPHLLSSIADSDPNILARVSHLIIDEADSLLDRGFAPLTSGIIDKATSSLQQLIMCSATIPRSMDTFLRKRFPDVNRLVTPNLHAIPRRVQLGTVDVEKGVYQGNKNLACADTIWAIGKAAAEQDASFKEETDVKRILVFVNERETTKEVADFLVSKGINAVALNRDTPDQRQSEMLATFTQATPLTIPKVTEHPGTLADNQPNYVPVGQFAPPSKKKLPNTKVLVTTDLGSRGIDTLAVRHVILYDVPHSTIDFIHRLGRTGRMGRRGRGIVLVGKHDRRDVVAEVKEGMFMGQALI